MNPVTIFDTQEQARLQLLPTIEANNTLLDELILESESTEFCQGRTITSVIGLCADDQGYSFTESIYSLNEAYPSSLYRTLPELATAIHQKIHAHQDAAFGATVVPLFYTIQQQPSKDLQQKEATTQRIKAIMQEPEFKKAPLVLQQIVTGMIDALSREEVQPRQLTTDEITAFSTAYAAIQTPVGNS